MIVQNKLTRKYGLANKKDNLIYVFYEDGSKALYSKQKFKEDFIKNLKEDLRVVYKVNGAYFTNKFDADWQERFLKENGYKVEKGFLCDTPKNIMERINHV